MDRGSDIREFAAGAPAERAGNRADQSFRTIVGRVIGGYAMETDRDAVAELTTAA